MNTVREKPTYLSQDVWRALWLLAQSRNKGIESPHPKTTADEIADQILREHIEANYPELFEHQKKLEKLDKELISQLEQTRKDK